MFIVLYYVFMFRHFIIKVIYYTTKHVNRMQRKILDQNWYSVDLLTKDMTSQAQVRDQGCVFFCQCVCKGLLDVGTGQQLGVELSWREKRRERVR